jgi:hypothetical protein
MKILAPLARMGATRVEQLWFQLGRRVFNRVVKNDVENCHVTDVISEKMLVSALCTSAGAKYERTVNIFSANERLSRGDANHTRYR